MYRTVFENGRKHLRILFIGSSQHIIFFQIEQRGSPSESIEPAKLRICIEIGHHLRTPDLVIMNAVLLIMYKCV